MKRKQAFKRSIQRGFTLVELAIVLVIAGIILVGVLKGTDAVNKAKVERSVADLRGLQGMLLEYQKRTGRLPGDCNNDGIIGYFPFAGPTAVYNTALLDNNELDRKLPSPALDTGPTGNCATAGTIETEQNLVWNDLRRDNIVDSNRLPAELAKNVNGSFYAVGTMTDGTGVNNANVIVVYSIPVWLAEAIDVSIDGVVSHTGLAAATTTAAANTGRVRRWHKNVNAGSPPVFSGGSFENGYAMAGETRDTLISISYQFDVNKLLN